MSVQTSIGIDTAKIVEELMDLLPKPPHTNNEMTPFENPPRQSQSEEQPEQTTQPEEVVSKPVQLTQALKFYASESGFLCCTALVGDETHFTFVPFTPNNAEFVRTITRAGFWSEYCRQGEFAVLFDYKEKRFTQEEAGILQQFVHPMTSGKWLCEFEMDWAFNLSALKDHLTDSVQQFTKKFGLPNLSAWQKSQLIVPQSSISHMSHSAKNKPYDPYALQNTSSSSSSSSGSVETDSSQEDAQRNELVRNLWGQESQTPDSDEYEEEQESEQEEEVDDDNDDGAEQESEQEEEDQQTSHTPPLFDEDDDEDQNSPTFDLSNAPLSVHDDEDTEDSYVENSQQDDEEHGFNEEQFHSNHNSDNEDEEEEEEGELQGSPFTLLPTDDDFWEEEEDSEEESQHPEPFLQSSPPMQHKKPKTNNTNLAIQPSTENLADYKRETAEMFADIKPLEDEYKLAQEAKNKAKSEPLRKTIINKYLKLIKDETLLKALNDDGHKLGQFYMELCIDRVQKLQKANEKNIYVHKFYQAIAGLRHAFFNALQLDSWYVGVTFSLAKEDLLKNIHGPQKMQTVTKLGETLTRTRTMNPPKRPRGTVLKQLRLKSLHEPSSNNTNAASPGEVRKNANNTSSIVYTQTSEQLLQPFAKELGPVPNVDLIFADDRWMMVGKNAIIKQDSLLALSLFSQCPVEFAKKLSTKFWKLPLVMYKVCCDIPTVKVTLSGASALIELPNVMVFFDKPKVNLVRSVLHFIRDELSQDYDSQSDMHPKCTGIDCDFGLYLEFGPPIEKLLRWLVACKGECDLASTAIDKWGKLTHSNPDDESAVQTESQFFVSLFKDKQ